MAKIPRCTSYTVCHLGLLEKKPCTSFDRTHLIKYHSNIKKESFYCRFAKKVLPLVRLPEHNMKFVCLCGKEILLAASFRCHYQRCEKVRASIEAESGKQPSKGGSTPITLADAYCFPPPLYRPLPPASATSQGNSPKNAAPTAARNQAPIPAPKPARPSNPVQGKTPLQKVAKDDPSSQQHRSSTFTQPPVQNTHLLQTLAGLAALRPVQELPPVQGLADATLPPRVPGEKDQLDQILRCMTSQTHQFHTIAQVMSESMAEHDIRLQAIERSVERSRLDILGRLTRVENSMSKAKEDQKQLLETLVGRFCDSLGQLEGLLATTEGKCSQLLFKLLDEFREGLSRQKNGPAVGSDSNDMAMSIAQQEQQLGLIQKAISSLVKEQKQHQQAVNKTITQTKSEQKQLLDTISESTDGNKERLRVLKQMLIVQRGALDRLEKGRTSPLDSIAIKNEPA